MDSLDRVSLERFRTVIARRLGLQFDDGRLDVLADALGQRLEAKKPMSPSAYLALLESGGNSQDELRILASHLTVAETYFFRIREHFRALAEIALPERMRLAQHRPLRLLSAGCASGEEAYSLAMVVREHLPQVSRSRVLITGVDINPAMLAKAREGRYSAWSLRDTTPEIQARYFHSDGKQFVLDEEIRSMVKFEERNLAVEEENRWAPEPYDVIFCRNVIMYLVPDAARFAVVRLTRALASGGFFFLSHAESLRGISQDFHLRHTHETFYYQKREGADTDPAARVDWVPEPTAAMPTVDVSWVDAVRRASEHIESLSRDSGNRGRSLPPVSPAATVAKAAPRSSAVQFGFALELLRQEKFRDALDVLSNFPPEVATDRDAQLLRAVLLINCGDVPGAEAVCRQILSSDDLNAGAHYVAALCREHAGDMSGAMEHDRAASYLDAEFAMPHLHLALLAKQAEDMPTARHELQQAGVLLLREDASRILLLGGGFGREALLDFSRAQLRSCGGLP